MTKTYFFLSYARANADPAFDPYLEIFFRDLEAEVREQEPEAVGFMDRRSIPAGKNWDEEIARALRECRVFVSVYSPKYFASEYCGKEWQAFQDRQDAYGKNPGLSIPVLWTPQSWLLGRMPAVLPEIQYTEGDFGAEYVDVGLKQLMKNDRYKTQYRTFVFKFAERLVKAARAHPQFPEATSLRSLGDIENPFAEKRKAELVPLTDAGPQFVEFILVAASLSEVKQAGLREVLDFYGEAGGLSWRPYWDEVPVPVGVEAQKVAGQWLLYSHAASVGNDLVESIREAERKNNIVVIILDAWTLQLEAYRQLMSRWGENAFYNCVLLIPWNRDDETAGARQRLVDRLAATFPNRILVSVDDPERKITSLDQFCIMDGINRWEDLLAVLHDSLDNVRTRISMVTPYVRRAGPGQRPPSVLLADEYAR